MPAAMPSVLVEPHVYQPYVARVRDAAGKLPVLSVLGRLTSMADAEAALASGVVDMAGAARAVLAEPDLEADVLANVALREPADDQGARREDECSGDRPDHT